MLTIWLIFGNEISFVDLLVYAKTVLSGQIALQLFENTKITNVLL